MKIYVAGPMTGYPAFNFPAFDEAAETLRELGHEVCNPAEHDRSEFGDAIEQSATGDPAEAAAVGFSLRDALNYDLGWITSTADAVAVLNGWESSKGARAEVATALALGLLVAPVRAFGPGVTVNDRRDLITAVPGSQSIAEIKASLPLDDYLTAVEADVQALAKVTALPSRIVTDETGEVRTVSSSGGEKGVKPARFDLIPAGPLWTVAELYGYGARKYAARNWEAGYEWSKSFGAMQRHAWEFWSGIDLDDPDKGGSGLPHLASVVFHAFALMEWMTTHPEFDDRPRPKLERKPAPADELDQLAKSIKAMETLGLVSEAYVTTMSTS